MAAEIAQLFSHQRVSGSKAAVALAIYLPLGLIIASLRLFMGLHVFIISCILPRHNIIRRVVMRIMCTILGFVVYPSGLENLKANTKILVANHVSVFDHVATGLLFPSVIPNVWSLPPFLSWALGYTNMRAAEGRNVFLQEVKKYCRTQTTPILAFPEGAMTNGTVGLLKFSTWAFSLNQDVQPIIITVHRPLININVEALGSSLWQDILWFLFVPFTYFRIKVLPVQKCSEFSTPEDFSNAVQHQMASALNVQVTPFTSADKAEYVKRLNVDLSSPGPGSRLHRGTAPPPHIPPPSSRQNLDITNQRTAALDKMVKQVQEVLPHVPEHLIRSDLETSNSVDVTIFNILENKLPVDVPITSPDTSSPSTSSATCQDTPTSTDTPTSEDTPPANQLDTSRDTGSQGDQSSGASSHPTPSPSSTKFAAEKFGKSSGERQKSLQERKAALLANARRHFEEK